ncbi:MAG: metallophosphoesterase, partial [Myxococcales bacterium]
AFLWMGVGVYLLVCLGALDLGRLLARLARRFSKPKADAPPHDTRRRQFLAQSGLLGAAVALPTSGYGWWRAFAPPQVTETTVELPGLPRALSGLAIAHLTDIHAGAWVDRDFVADLVERTNALRPDLVAITGDLVDGSVERLAEVVAPLGSLRSRFGTFFALGNHEYYSGAEQWTAHLRSMGMRVLINETASIEGLDIVGVGDWSMRWRGRELGYDLDAALAGRVPGSPAILLAHQPRGFEQAIERGIGLQLSGHTHGGQIWPWTLAVKLAYHPYCAGLYRSGDRALYVSRGCGFWGPPVRVGAPPEIARIVLV